VNQAGPPKDRVRPELGDGAADLLPSMYESGDCGSVGEAAGKNLRLGSTPLSLLPFFCFFFFFFSFYPFFYLLFVPFSGAKARRDDAIPAR